MREGNREKMREGMRKKMREGMRGEESLCIYNLLPALDNDNCRAK